MAQIYTYYMEPGGKNILAGRLFTHERKNNQTAGFEYTKEWLAGTGRLALQPSLPFGSGTFYTSSPLFGVFADSAPDSWGRLLMRRYEEQQAKNEGRLPKTLSQADFLLRVCDYTRQGALRFKTDEGGEFLAPVSQNSTPPLKSISQLLSASDRVISNQEDFSDLNLLIDPGSSLGGARPKSAVVDFDGSLSIAKFPRKDDEINQVVWEHIALLLAEKAGINTTKHRLENISGRQVLIVKRFDRAGEQRIHFLSAMSMLEAQDFDDHNYLELASAIKQHSVRPKEDLAQLWRRIVFGILVSNSDDHLRNHGFLFAQNGWVLSPAYDINPNATRRNFHATTLTETKIQSSVEGALEICDQFMLTNEKAQSILKEVNSAVGQWKNVAGKLGLKVEIKRMEPAFLI